MNRRNFFKSAVGCVLGLLGISAAGKAKRPLKVTFGPAACDRSIEPDGTLLVRSSGSFTLNHMPTDSEKESYFNLLRGVYPAVPDGFRRESSNISVSHDRLSVGWKTVDAGVFLQAPLKVLA